MDSLFSDVSALLHDLPSTIKTIGILGTALIVFAESGLFFGFFLPGDSLVVTAGLLASQGYFPITVLVPILIAAAITGDSVGYAFGKSVGPSLFSREDSLFFKKRYVESSRLFFEKYGPMSIVLARFVPAARTFTPILAGVGGMHYPTFLFWNIAGGFIWAGGLTLFGYFLGNLIPDVDRYLLPIIAAIVVLSVLPAAVGHFRRRE